jgi:hypothetical protein
MERSAYQTDRPQAEPQRTAFYAAAEARMLEAMLARRRAAQLPAFDVEDRKLFDSLRLAAEITDRRTASVLKQLAEAHQSYRTSGLHERAEGIAMAATILVWSGVADRRGGGAA